MTIKQKVLSEAKSLGITVESGGDPFEVNLEAPQGHCFDGDLHELINSAWDDMTSTDVWKDAYKRMMDTTIAPCNHDCDWWG